MERNTGQILDGGREAGDSSWCVPWLGGRIGVRMVWCGGGGNRTEELTGGSFKHRFPSVALCWGHSEEGDKVKNNVKQELSNAERLAIKTDAWTSCATDSYVAFTAHHISPGWELRSHVLQTRVFNQSHTGKNIGALLKEPCVDWNIPDKKNQPR